MSPILKSCEYFTLKIDFEQLNSKIWIIVLKFLILFVKGAFKEA